MTSGKQRRTELREERARKAAAARLNATTRPGEVSYRTSEGRAVVNPALLAPTSSYGIADFVARGYYEDKDFTCKDCNKDEVWTATQQKWWYEIAKGGRETTAVRCRRCRQAERARREQARSVHLDGLARKQADKAKR